MATCPFSLKIFLFYTPLLCKINYIYQVCKSLLRALSWVGGVRYFTHDAYCGVLVNKHIFFNQNNQTWTVSVKYFIWLNYLRSNPSTSPCPATSPSHLKWRMACTYRALFDWKILAGRRWRSSDYRSSNYANGFWRGEWGIGSKWSSDHFRRKVYVTEFWASAFKTMQFFTTGFGLYVQNVRCKLN